MRVFLTGATGYIGSAVADALLRAGHEVTALVRHAGAAEALAAWHVGVVTGDLGDPETYAAKAAGFEAYVHTAFEPSARGVEVDRSALATLLAAARQARPGVFVYTSGIWVLGNTQGAAAEDAPLDPTPLVAFRVEHERLVLDANGGGLRTCVVRPGVVYGGARGIISEMLTGAEKGLLRVIGPGDNRWPTVYDHDLAELYALLLADPGASGVYHATDESADTVKEIASAIVAYVSAAPSVRHVPLAEARQKLGPYADALALDQVVVSPRARALGWQPSLPSVTRAVPRLFEEWRSGRANA
jgi:nucleoside-diphosphate-sugar epimerase